MIAGAAGARSTLGPTAYRAVLGAAVALLLAIAIAGPAAAAERCGGRHWVGSWNASPSDLSAQSVGGQTLRMILHPHFAGDTVRVRLTNRFGSDAETFTKVTIARREKGAALLPGSVRALTFGGKREVTLPPGSDVVSDPTSFSLQALRDIAVSLYAAAPAGRATEHIRAEQTSYVGTGDHVDDEAGDAFGQTTNSWYVVSGVDVLAPEGTAAVVTFGDSITDGFQGGATPVTESSAGYDKNVRYPDGLARRLLAAHRDLSVLNAAISGNRINNDEGVHGFGPAGLARLNNDVVAQSGVTDVIVLEGINDIGGAGGGIPASADDVIAGLGQIVERLHISGLRVQLGTLTPATGFVVPSYGDSEANAAREQVNAWIRTSGVADGVVDFDAAIRDPSDHSRMNPRLDSGDHLHPNADGYAVMAAAVDVDALRGRACAETPTASAASGASAPRLDVALRRSPTRRLVHVRVRAGVPLRDVTVTLRRGRLTLGSGHRAGSGVVAIRLHRSWRPGPYTVVVRARTSSGRRLVERRRMHLP